MLKNEHPKHPNPKKPSNTKNLTTSLGFEIGIQVKKSLVEPQHPGQQGGCCGRAGPNLGLVKLGLGGWPKPPSFPQGSIDQALPLPGRNCDTNSQTLKGESLKLTAPFEEKKNNTKSERGAYYLDGCDQPSGGGGLIRRFITWGRG